MLERIGNDLQGAKWLRPASMGAGERDKMQAAWYRLEFKLRSVPRQALLRVTARDRYKLYVNGELVCAGPRKGDKWNHYYETVDLAPYLKTGVNALTARVYAYAASGLLSPQAAPMSVYVSPCGIAFLAEGKIEQAGGVMTLSTADADWTALRDDSVAIDNTDAMYVGYTEKRRLALEPSGWRDPQPLGWPRAAEIGITGINPWGEFSDTQLKERPIPNLSLEKETFFEEMPQREASDITPFTFGKEARATIPKGEKRRVVLAANELKTAFFLLQAKGEGATVTITYAERYFPLDSAQPTGSMKRDDWQTGLLKGQHDVITLGRGKGLFESFWMRTFRFVQLDVQAADEPVELEMPRFIVTRYPLNVTGSIRFETLRLAYLWDKSLLTLKNCMHETHEDCPYYEQLQYTLDTRLQMLFTYAVSGDTRLARAVLWDYHSSLLPDGMLQSRYPCTRTQVIPAFALHWIFMLSDYYTQTADAELLKFYRPTMDAVLAYFDRHINKSGLVEGLGYWDYADWVRAWDKHAGVPDAARCGASSIHNLTYALALQTAAHLMAITGRAGMAEEYTARANAILKAVRALCLDERRGLVLEGPGVAQYTQHAQSLAVLTGLFGGDAAKRAMNAALDDPSMLPCSFPWQFTLFRALDKAGLYDRTAELWPQYTDLLALNLTTIPERPGDTRSDCHAWSALPLYEMPRMLLGIQPAAPGWEKIRIQPHPVMVDRLDGSFPTPKGMVSVQWDQTAGEFHIAAKTPRVPTEIILPDGRHFTFSNGHFEI